MPRFNLDVVLYWGSLGLSAAAVVLFLWLMRERGRRDDVKPPEEPPRP